jgi:hypothetical protein
VAVIRMMEATKDAHKHSYSGMDLYRRPQHSMDLNQCCVDSNIMNTSHRQSFRLLLASTLRRDSLTL